MITSSAIHNTLLKAGVDLNSISRLDGSYSCPKKEWVLDASFKISNQIKGMLGDWVPEARDCDDFALATMSLMRLAHSKSQTQSSLAVGYFQFYSVQLKMLHAINIAFLDSSRFIFFEPQNGRILTLTRGEIESCSRLII